MSERSSDTRAAIAGHFRAILELLGLEPDHQNFRRTPERVADLLLETATSGGPGPVMTTFPNGRGRDVVSIAAVPVYVLCPHHFLPYFGEARVTLPAGGASA
jgi:GTP cyclohydrolase I